MGNSRTKKSSSSVYDRLDKCMKRKPHQQGNGVFTRSRGSTSGQGKDLTSKVQANRAPFLPSRRRQYENTDVGRLLKQFETYRKECFEGGHKRPDMQAMKLLNDRKRQKIRGPNVPGVSVNDCFEWRAEMYVIGLHCKPVSGIDMMFCDRLQRHIAISIVDSGGYQANRVETNYEELTYSGEGGKSPGGKHYKDQKMTNGNLALKICYLEEIPVRVIRAHRFSAVESSSKTLFCYYGMYRVVSMTQDYGPVVFKFGLRREQDQPPLKDDVRFQPEERIEEDRNIDENTSSAVM